MIQIDEYRNSQVEISVIVQASSEARLLEFGNEIIKILLSEPRGQDIRSMGIKSSSIFPFRENGWTGMARCEYVLHQISSVNATQLSFHLPWFLCDTSHQHNTYA